MQTFVKHTGYKSHKGGKSAKGMKAIKAHVKYIQNRADELGQHVTRELFGKDGEMSRQDFYKILEEQPQKGVIAHKLVISMDRKDYEEQNIDLKELVKDTMSQWEAKTGRQLNWIATIHDKASNPHAHVVIAGRDREKKEVVIKPNHLQQLKRVADKERSRLFDRNMSRNRLHNKDLLKEFNPANQIAKEKTFEKVIDKAVKKSLDKALYKLCPKLALAKNITKTIQKGFDLSR